MVCISKISILVEIYFHSGANLYLKYTREIKYPFDSSAPLKLLTSLKQS